MSDNRDLNTYLEQMARDERVGRANRLRQIDPICEALTLGSKLVEATEALTEAVRALKPAPVLLVEKDNPSAVFRQLQEVADRRNTLQVEVDRLLADNVRLRAEQKLDGAEIERLQKVIADQALTIGTLKDELARVRDFKVTP